MGQDQTPPAAGDPTATAKPVAGTADLKKSQATLKHLESQPKVSVLLERREGEPPILDFCVNGVRYSVERGVPTKVPQQIAQMLYDKLASENKVSQLSKEMVDKLAEIKMA